MKEASLSSLRVVRPKRLYEQIAEQIEELIRARKLSPGSKLPGERELADSLGVSRPSIREALIALETAGYVEFRGASGNYVREPAPTGTASPLWGVDMGPGPLEQFEARRAIEAACAELAATRATDEQIERMEACFLRMEAVVRDGGNPSQEHRQFHVMLAEASRNNIMQAAVRELWTLRQGEMWETLRKRVENAESFRAGLAFRRHLLDCLKRRDSTGTRAAMDGHFARVARLYFDTAE